MSASSDREQFAIPRGERGGGAPVSASPPTPPSCTKPPNRVNLVTISTRSRRGSSSPLDDSASGFFLSTGYTGSSYGTYAIESTPNDHVHAPRRATPRRAKAGPYLRSSPPLYLRRTERVRVEESMYSCARDMWIMVPGSDVFYLKKIHLVNLSLL